MNSREYRLLRERRRAARIEANRKRTHSDVEAEHLIGFARMWAPFGGASEEEILVHFGMTAHRFVDRLWQVIAESRCTESEILGLARVYPRNQGITASIR
ncbi:hypothetical protein P3H15_36885 [Rhodococcus sp. T2V]|nr:hypothetical protein [Rhodococcus sp. T2V]MDF3310595.1 hypothetical protein [Rhodococcus sp. T2V]